jgi:hypothetical protein
VTLPEENITRVMSKLYVTPFSRTVTHPALPGPVAGSPGAGSGQSKRT